MCELTVYTEKGERIDKVMEGVVRLLPRNGTVLMENIFGESKEIKGRLGEVNIVGQKASIVLP
ncbi:MAG TPA: CooT family nickel-binding protein [Methanothrix sp.]|nr:CooT family nickel-binding protein [Methanothrix sp.]